MKNFPADLITHLAGDTHTLAWCVIITRKDATVYRYTTYDANLTVGGQTYKADPGFRLTDFAFDVEGSVTTFSLDFSYKSGEVTKVDVIGGLFDNATVQLYLVNYHDTAQTALIIKAHVGKPQIKDNECSLECHSLMQHLHQRVGDLVSPTCRAIFADKNDDNLCKLDPASYTFAGAVVSIISDGLKFTDTTIGAAQVVDNYFTNGKITFTAGNNDGLSMEVQEHDLTGGKNTITLALPLAFTLTIGDTFDAKAGCDGTTSNCSTKFLSSNILNFRGEPHVPGPDVVGQYPEM